MHPDLSEPAFAHWYTSPALRAIAAELMGCTDEQLQMGACELPCHYPYYVPSPHSTAHIPPDLIELFNILINPTSHDFALRWHRDAVDGTASEEEEARILKVAQYGVSRHLSPHIHPEPNILRLADTMEHVRCRGATTERDKKLIHPQRAIPRQLPLRRPRLTSRPAHAGAARAFDRY